MKRFFPLFFHFVALNYLAPAAFGSQDQGPAFWCHRALAENKALSLETLFVELDLALPTQARLVVSESAKGKLRVVLVGSDEITRTNLAARRVLGLEISVPQRLEAAPPPNRYVGLAKSRTPAFLAASFGTWAILSAGVGFVLERALSIPEGTGLILSYFLGLPAWMATTWPYFGDPSPTRLQLADAQHFLSWVADHAMNDSSPQKTTVLLVYDPDRIEGLPSARGFTKHASAEELEQVLLKAAGSETVLRR